MGMWSGTLTGRQVDACVQVYLLAEACGESQVSSVIARPLTFTQGLSLTLELTVLASLASQLDPGSLWLCLPGAGIANWLPRPASIYGHSKLGSKPCSVI